MDNKPEGRRIHNLDELIELWPAVLVRMKKRMGVTAAAYLHDADPVALNEKEVVLEYRNEFHFEKVVEASKRLPFEQVLNECLASPHRLRFQVARQRES